MSFCSITMNLFLLRCLPVAAGSLLTLSCVLGILPSLFGTYLLMNPPVPAVRGFLLPSLRPTACLYELREFVQVDEDSASDLAEQLPMLPESSPLVEGCPREAGFILKPLFVSEWYESRCHGVSFPFG
jgi:hypothetical protein